MINDQAVNFKPDINHPVFYFLKAYNKNTTMYIHVKVTAGSKTEEFVELKADHFMAKVREKAERNMANSRVIELVAQYFKIPKNRVCIINGHQSPSKLLVVEK